MRPSTPSLPPSLPQSRGFSLVELMVGVGMGLFVVLIAMSALSAHLRESRKLILEARLMQELRTSADIVTRDLRRAGYWAAADRAVVDNTDPCPVQNPYSADWAPTGPVDNISFKYSHDATENNAVDSNEQLGYRLKAGVLEAHLGASGWQAVTDVTAIKVTEFSIAPVVQRMDLGAFCARTCASAGATTPPSAACTPRQEIRSLVITLAAQLSGEPGVARRLRSEVRVRNDTLAGACAA